MGDSVPASIRVSEGIFMGGGLFINQGFCCSALAFCAEFGIKGLGSWVVTRTLMSQNPCSALLPEIKTNIPKL